MAESAFSPAHEREQRVSIAAMVVGRGVKSFKSRDLISERHLSLSLSLCSIIAGARTRKIGICTRQKWRMGIFAPDQMSAALSHIYIKSSFYWNLLLRSRIPRCSTHTYTQRESYAAVESSFISFSLSRFFCVALCLLCSPAAAARPGTSGVFVAANRKIHQNRDEWSARAVVLCVHTQLSFERSQVFAFLPTYYARWVTPFCISRRVLACARETFVSKVEQLQEP